MSWPYDYAPVRAEKNDAAPLITGPIGENAKRLLPADSAERKKFPMCTGLLDYFPDALAEVARISHEGNKKHNPGQRTHWARGKSMDHGDCAMRHLVERGGFDGTHRHTACLAWRALAMLQEELEAEGGYTTPRGATELPPR